MLYTMTRHSGAVRNTAVRSFKTFSTVLLISLCHDICRTTAQMEQLPTEFRMEIDNIKMHFCSERGGQSNCAQLTSPVTLCSQLYRPPGCRLNCWPQSSLVDADSINSPRCPQSLFVCGYSDAEVCSLNTVNGRQRFCLYGSPQTPFCMCGSQTQWVMCNETDNTMFTTGISRTPLDDDSDETTPHSLTDQSPIETTVIVSRGKGNRQGGGINEPATVLGCLFGVVLLVVIIGAVMIYLRRKGRLPSFKGKASEREPRELSRVDLEAMEQRGKAKLSELPVPGGNLEYSYAYDHRPSNEDPNIDDHTYYSVGDQGRGSARYVKNEPGQTPSAGKTAVASTVDANDHAYFVLEKTQNQEDDAVKSEDGGTSEMTDSSTGVHPKKGDDDDYTPLIPTVDLKSPHEHAGDEVPSSNGNAVPSTDDSSTDALSKRDDSTYFPLIPKDHSGYEDAEVPASPTKSDVSSSQTGDVSKKEDNNNYTPLVPTVEHKSQNKNTGYEVVEDAYDHLDRKEETSSTEDALSMADDYQHLSKGK